MDLFYCFAQDTDRFSNNKEEESQCCWNCAVRVRSFCSGCRRARYCSVECLEEDWCQRRRRKKEEKKMREMIERVRKDIEEDNIVD